MRLTRIALKNINQTHIRPKIALALGVSEQTVIRYIYANHENLTKIAAIEVIVKETGMKQDEIIDKTSVIA